MLPSGAGSVYLCRSQLTDSIIISYGLATDWYGGPLRRFNYFRRGWFFGEVFGEVLVRSLWLLVYNLIIG